GFRLEVETIVLAHAIFRRMRGRISRQSPHQIIDVFEFLQRLPASVALPPIEIRREPDRESFGKIFVRMALRIPVVQMHYITAAERSRSISVRRFFVGSLPKNLCPSFIVGKMV